MKDEKNLIFALFPKWEKADNILNMEVEGARRINQAKVGCVVIGGQSNIIQTNWTIRRSLSSPGPQ